MGTPLNIPDLIENPHPQGFLGSTIATVDDETPVTFDPDLGPLVNVITHPAGAPVVCRVAMRIAGKGEAEYFPFMPGDEVLVVILENNTRSGGVIVGRLCNGTDKFPETVAGQTTSNNNFSFTRSIAPHLSETNGPILMRQGTTGAFISVAVTGTITLRTADKSALQLSPDVMGMQSGDGKYLVQLDVTNGRYTVQVEDSLFVLSSSRANPEKSAIAVPGTFAIYTAANPASEHAISTEAVVNFLSVLLLQLGAAVPGPLTGAALVAAVPTLIPLVVSAAAISPLLPTTALSIVSAFTSATQKPPAVPLQGQLFPGIGCAGFFIG